MNSLTPHEGAVRCAVKVISTQETADRGERIRGLVACRAYDLYERRGRIEAHGEEDWSQAEAETIFQIPIGMMQSHTSLSIYAGTCGANAGDLAICVEPRRLTVVKRVPLATMHRRRKGRTPVQIFRVVDLPVEVIPSKVKAYVKSRLLQVEIAKRKDEAQAA